MLDTRTHWNQRRGGSEDGYGTGAILAHADEHP